MIFSSVCSFSGKFSINSDICEHHRIRRICQVQSKCFKFLFRARRASASRTLLPCKCHEPPLGIQTSQDQSLPADFGRRWSHLTLPLPILSTRKTEYHAQAPGARFSLPSVASVEVPTDHTHLACVTLNPQPKSQPIEDLKTGVA